MSKIEKRKQLIAIIVLSLICLPILIIYFSFFQMSFIDNSGNFTLSNFDFIFNDIQIKQTHVPSAVPAIRNTVLFTLVVTVAEVSIACMSGYALSRLEFKGKKVIKVLILSLRLFPGMLLLISVLYILLYLKIVNTLLGVILVGIAFRLPGSTYIIKNFFDGIPNDVENSTLVDGCTRFSSFFQVIVHLVKPGIASICVFSFMSAWSNYLLFNTLIFNSKTPVLATYIRSLSRNEQMIADYGIFAAMALVYMLPVIVFFFISQKQLMNQNISGGKGL